MYRHFICFVKFIPGVGFDAIVNKAFFFFLNKVNQTKDCFPKVVFNQNQRSAAMVPEGMDGHASHQIPG